MNLVETKNCLGILTFHKKVVFEHLYALLG